MMDWVSRSIFYHIYPLGLCGAPQRNDFTAAPADRLQKLHQWLPHLQRLGINGIYLGPIFESTAHGYDTADFFTVDRRLGTNASCRALIANLRQHGIRVILDGVFHHVGRDFWAFRDVRQHLQSSRFCDWFTGLAFDGHSPFHDPFCYEGWKDHYDLVKLNLHHPAVRQHLFKAVETWIREWNIDGLRLDAADCIDKDFLRALSSHCTKLAPDFWLMGEVVAGDYRDWAPGAGLDSVTNYECYKGLYSSHVDRNYFEIAYSLNRQFGGNGLYKDLLLYSFADNHDVSRVASRLDHPPHLYPLYCLLFTMPGIPSIYYGSEWGIPGQKGGNSDAPLRPALELETISRSAPHPDLVGVIARLAAIRAGSAALQRGSYQQLHVAAQQLAFVRQSAAETVLVVVNGADRPVGLKLSLPDLAATHLRDLLNPGETFPIIGQTVTLPTVAPNWARILIAA